MSNDDIQKISVAGQSIGILGFKAVLDELKDSLAQTPEEHLERELLARLSRKNYIPEKVRDEYGRALAREFRKQLGQVVPEEKSKGLVIRVLGQGCSNCRALTQRIMEVLTETNLPADLEHVTDIKEIARYGILQSPALIVNNKLVAKGTVPSKKQILDILKQATEGRNL
jgi:small redox-active disulfide protein 2